MCGNSELLAETIEKTEAELNTKHMMDLLMKSLIDHKLNCFNILLDKVKSLMQGSWSLYTFRLSLIGNRESGDEEEMTRVGELIGKSFITPGQKYAQSVPEPTPQRSVESLMKLLEDTDGYNDEDVSIHRQKLWFEAAEEGNIQWLKEIAQQGININCQNKENATALQIVASKNNPECIQFLAQHQAFIPQPKIMPVICGMPENRNPFRWKDGPLTLTATTLNIKGSEHECSERRLECIKLLLNRTKIDLSGCDLKEEVHKTLVNICTYSGDLNVLRFLLDTVVDVNYSSSLPPQFHSYNQTVLCVVLERVSYNRDNIVRMLLDAGSNVDGVDNNIPMHFCRTVKDMNLLLDRGADINKQNSKGETPLMKAIPRQEAHRMVRMLLKKGNVYFENTTGTGNDVMERRNEIMESGNDIIIDVNQQDDNGRSALLTSCISCAVNCTQLLLTSGANINIQDTVYKHDDPFEKSVPLSHMMWSVRNVDREPYISIVKLLVKNGSLLLDGKCQPLLMAIEKNQTRVVKIMLRALSSHKKLKQLQMCIDKMVPEEIQQEINTRLAAPYSLKHIVRNTIREQLNHLRLINKLDTPAKMKEYLYFSELDPM